MSELKRDDLPPHLAALSDKDLEGLQKRAAREGVPIERLQLRKSIRPGMPALTPQQETKRDALGILARKEKEGKSLKELPLRRTDNPWVLADAMADICIRSGSLLKSDGKGPTTVRLTEEDLKVLDKVATDEEEGEE